MRKTLKLLVLMSFIPTVFSVGAALSATVGLRPVDVGLLNGSGQIEVSEGEQFALELFVDGLLTTASVPSGYGLFEFWVDVNRVDVNLDQLVSYVGFTANDAFVTGNGEFDVEIQANKVRFHGRAYDNGQIETNSIILATLNFECLGTGESTLLTTPYHWSEHVPMNNWRISNGFDINAPPIYLNESSITYTDIVINQVPTAGLAIPSIVTPLLLNDE